MGQRMARTLPAWDAPAVWGGGSGGGGGGRTKRASHVTTVISWSLSTQEAPSESLAQWIRGGLRKLWAPVADAVLGTAGEPQNVRHTRIGSISAVRAAV